METQFSLKSSNSFGFDVTAKYYKEIRSLNELQLLIQTPIFKQEKILILGGGNNLLFCDDYYDGIVVHINTKGIETISEGENEVIIRAKGGEDWGDFVKEMVARNLHGVENLAHIPGTVGAAPVQNIGAYGMELKDSFVQCEAIHLLTGEIKVFQKADCQFGYRNSIFKGPLKGQYAILSVDFKLLKNAPLQLTYGNIQSVLAKKGIVSPTISQLHDCICEIRDAKLPDVKKIGNAGSFFKNPVIDKELFDQLIKEYPEMPHYEEPNERVKIPAGWLIEKAGWKGYRNGTVGVYEQQALVLVHFGGGCGKDIINLSRAIQNSVKSQFGIEIGAEVNFI